MQWVEEKDSEGEISRDFLLLLQENNMANDDPIWRDLDNINGHNIYTSQKSPSDTAINVNSVYAAKMKKTRAHCRKHYMTMTAKISNNENIYHVNVRRCADELGWGRNLQLHAGGHAPGHQGRNISQLQSVRPHHGRHENIVAAGTMPRRTSASTGRT